MKIHLREGGGRGWGAKTQQFLIGRRIRANIPLSVDESEVQKGGHFCAFFYFINPEVEHGAPPSEVEQSERTWPKLAELGEDILLETNPQNRARPQDDVSRASPNSFKLDLRYYIYNVTYNI